MAIGSIIRSTIIVRVFINIIREILHDILTLSISTNLLTIRPACTLIQTFAGPFSLCVTTVHAFLRLRIKSITNLAVTVNRDMGIMLHVTVLTTTIDGTLHKGMLSDGYVGLSG